MIKNTRSFFAKHVRKKKVNRKVKDSLFRFIFEKDREALLQLYNALNGTDYQDTEQLQIVTIESAVYIVMKNDLAFVVTGVLSMYEHQSTYNPNMPVRFFIYLGQEYQKIIEKAGNVLYSPKLITLPTPQCVVFYNGKKEVPEEQILKLSDAFENKVEESDVELKVRMLNINYGHNTALMKQCKMLKEYAQFVDISRKYAEKGKNVEESLEQAIEFCIENNILSNVLREYRAEVLGMILEEFDAKKYEKVIREDEHEIAYAEGKEEGIRLFIEATEATGFEEAYTKKCIQNHFSLDNDKVEELYKKYAGKTKNK